MRQARFFGRAYVSLVFLFFSRAADEKLPRKRGKQMKHGKTTLLFGRSSHCRDIEGLGEMNGTTGHKNIVVGILWAMTT